MNFERVKKGKPFLSLKDAFEKFGTDWKKISTCSHINDEGFNFKQCIKCGRVIFETDKFNYFYLVNGSRYLIKRRKNNGKCNEKSPKAITKRTRKKIKKTSG